MSKSRLNMKKPTPYKIAMSAGLDAGNRNMKKENRGSWNQDDWDKACEQFKRVMRLHGMEQPE